MVAGSIPAGRTIKADAEAYRFSYENTNAKIQEGDIVENARNHFRRIIRRVAIMDKNEALEIRYFYSEEKLDASLKPTGQFNEEITGDCNQTNMLGWQNGQ